MTYDPIIEEIRKIRHQIEAECENDAEKYFKHLEKIQTEYKQLVRRGPKPRLQVKSPKQERMPVAQ